MLKTQQMLQPKTLTPITTPNNQHDLEWCKLCGRLKFGVIMAPKPANGPTCGFHQWVTVLKVDLETKQIDLVELPSNGAPELVKNYTQTGESCPDCGHLFLKTGAGCGMCPNCGTTGGCT